MIYWHYKAAGNLLKAIIGNNSILTQTWSFGYHADCRLCYSMHSLYVRKLKSNSSGKVSQKVICLHEMNKMFWQCTIHIWYDIQSTMLFFSLFHLKCNSSQIKHLWFYRECKILLLFWLHKRSIMTLGFFCLFILFLPTKS